ncbi:hypothetical protein EAD96_23465 [Micromonospora sp. BL1]|nr:hypothetical protein EAD96_23465 [Micromonospora sp. BL1]
MMSAIRDVPERPVPATKTGEGDGMDGSQTPGPARRQSIYPRRDQLTDLLADAIGSVTVAHPTRVAVDGPPAAGKTTLADELAAVLRARGRYVIRATVDDFLFPRARRYRRGEFSAEGCYVDTHDHGALKRVLLDPLGPGGDRRFRRTVYDHATDTVLSPPLTTAPADAVLIVDGVFLLRPELVDRWELRVFVSTALDRTVDRAVIREREVSPRADVERRWRERYLPAQRLYFATARPVEHADVVVHNDDPAQPIWETRARSGGRLATMDRNRVAAWIAAYEQAWRTPGTAALGTMFTSDASYRQGPYRDPVVGLPAITRMWDSERDGPDEVFEMTAEVVAVDGDTAVARVQVRYGDPVDQEWRDLWIMRFAEDGRCLSFEEWPFAPGKQAAGAG